MEGIWILAWFRPPMARKEGFFGPFEAHAVTRVAGATELCAEPGVTITLSLSGLMATGFLGFGRLLRLGGG